MTRLDRLVLLVACPLIFLLVFGAVGGAYGFLVGSVGPVELAVLLVVTAVPTILVVRALWAAWRERRPRALA